MIVDHGKGWTSLITGLDRLKVRQGGEVAQGQPIGSVAPGPDPRLTVELRRRVRDLEGLVARLQRDNDRLRQDLDEDARKGVRRPDAVAASVPTIVG